MSYKRITKQERSSIEQMLRKGDSIYPIAKELMRSPSTITKEIKANRTQTSFRSAFNKKYPDNNCARVILCDKNHLCKICNGTVDACRQCMRCNAVCEAFEPVFCPKRDSSPWCCNGCPKRRRCHLVKYDYRAKEAHLYAQKKLVESRSGLALSDEDVLYLDRLITPLLKKGQSIHHIYVNHKDQMLCSEKTLYTYLHAGLFTATLFDLPRTVQRKPRRKKPQRKVDKACYIGRSYEDYKQWRLNNPGVPTIEMDTVEGSKTSRKVLLTFVWPQSSFLMAYLLERQTASEVKRVITHLQDTLGTEMFNHLFPALLTDRGNEFTDPLAIEGEANRWTYVFFCDARRPEQKPHVENGHTLLRQKLPKGSSFDNLTQEDVKRILSHVNSVKRKGKNDKSSIEIFRFTYGQAILDLFGVQEIEPDAVDLTKYKKKD